MSEAKHTPGPWRYSAIMRPPIGNEATETDKNGNVFWGYSISGSDERGTHILPTLAAVHNFPGNVEANARLIAAAPELLEALKGALEWMSSVEAHLQDAQPFKRNKSAYEAAVFKAQGRLP